MILIGLLFEYFLENIANDDKFPNNVIHVRKQDVSNIYEIHFEYKTDEINLTNSSLSIDLSEIEYLGNRV